MMEIELRGKRASEMKSSGFSMTHLEKKEKNRMFNFITKTWNPVVGCKHDCSYCWARKLAEGKLKEIERYKNGFKPKLIQKEVSKRFKEGKIIFVSDMGDLWGNWVPKDWILAVLNTIQASETNFLFLTKNPTRYLEFLNVIPENAILGATIETNRSTSAYSKAPLPEERLKAMQEIRSGWDNNIMISIEPVMDFDFSDFLSSLKKVKPDFIVIGRDNYGNNLPEPTLEKILSFIYELKCFTRVILKSSLRNQILKKFND